MEEKNFLGIDWGKSKIGVALAHGETRIAVAYGIFKNDDVFLETLKKIVQEEMVETIIIGIPRYGKETIEEHPAKIFGQKLQKVLGVEVVFSNEMFTSKMAQDSLIVQGYSAVGAQDDAEAAKILLQAWLDQVGL